MNIIETFINLTDDVFDMSWYCWPVTLILVLNLIFAFTVDKPFAPTLRIRTLLASLPVCFPFIVLLIISLRLRSAFLAVVLLIAILQLVWAVVSIKSMKGARWSAISLAVCHLSFLFAAWFVGAWQLSGG